MKLIMYFYSAILFVFNSCGQTRSSYPDVLNCTKDISLSDLRFFSKVGFYNYKNIEKWERDVTVSVVGDGIRKGDEEVVHTLISELSELIKPLKMISIKKGNADITINYTAKNDNDLKFGKSTARFKWLITSIFNKARVTIYATSNGLNRKYVLYHEMMHAIGFNHPKFANEPFKINDSRIQGYNLKGYDEVENEKFLEQNYKYSDLDKKMIRLLYSPCLFAGYKKEDFDKILKELDAQPK